jgi:hypothetical protein
VFPLPAGEFSLGEQPELAASSAQAPEIRTKVRATPRISLLADAIARRSLTSGPENVGPSGMQSEVGKDCLKFDRNGE